MAAKKKGAKPVEVEVDGIAVRVDAGYASSWDGLCEIARMQSDELSESERFLATMGFYRNVVENVDEVVAALGGGSLPANDILSFLARAVVEATPKNS